MMKTRSICLVFLVVILAKVLQINLVDASEISGSNGNGTRVSGGRFVSIGNDRQQAGDNSVTLYKEPSSLVISILRNFFDDIDWDTIDRARVQVEKFIQKVDKMIGSVRSIFTKATGSADNPMPREGNPLASRWWTGGGGATKSQMPGDSLDSSTRVKEMLERVACFVGYMRLMNLSNEALAELDAAKVVTNLFGGSAKRTNSSGWNWFG